MPKFSSALKVIFALTLTLIYQTELAADPSLPPLVLNLNEVQPAQQFVSADTPEITTAQESPETADKRANNPLNAISQTAPTTPVVQQPNLPNTLAAPEPIATPLGLNAKEEIQPNPLVGGLAINEFSQCEQLGSGLCRNTQDPTQFKICVIQRLTQPNCKQYIAFISATNMSARDDVDMVKQYPELDLIHLVRYGANYPGVYYALGKNGTLVDLIFGRQTQALDIRKDIHYPEIAAQYPNVMLFSIVNKLPTVEQPGPDGAAIRLTLRFQLLNGCHACERAGFANVAYDFSENGTLLSTSIESLDP